MIKTTLTLLMLGALALGCDADKQGAIAADGAIGIAACDEYIAKMEACIEKLPADAKDPQTLRLKAAQEGWKSAAKGDGKEGVAAACKTALDTMANEPPCK